MTVHAQAGDTTPFRVRRVADLLHDTRVRTERYRTLIPEYYTRVTDAYRRGWSDSFHFASFLPGQSLEDALRTNETKLADLAGLRSGMHALDVGCGVGGPALTIAEHSGARVTGLNITAHQVAIARRRAAERDLSAQAEFIAGDAMEMPFPDEMFDVVYAFDAVCYMPDKDAFFRQCARVLKPSGLYIAQDWHARDGLTAEERHTWIEPICRYHCIPDLLSPSDTRAALDRAGFETLHCNSLGDDGDVLPNWKLLDSGITRGIHRHVARLIPPLFRMLVGGGYALLDGVKSGAFLLARTVAQKRGAS